MEEIYEGFYGEFYARQKRVHAIGVYHTVLAVCLAVLSLLLLVLQTQTGDAIFFIGFWTGFAALVQAVIHALIASRGNLLMIQIGMGFDLCFMLLHSLGAVLTQVSELFLQENLNNVGLTVVCTLAAFISCLCLIVACCETHPAFQPKLILTIRQKESAAIVQDQDNWSPTDTLSFSVSRRSSGLLNDQ
ncbi:hypothetical protein Ciccas_011888 [Cichlidogyrus casuarinus]|uniref:Uncharacterized protein n=1 Tax=Cichlidogyrus casuarinus TaxID=1844966 RepID=A0ABD2PQV4_9PLAT